MQKFIDIIYEELLNEKAIKSEFDKVYLGLLKKIKKEIPWDKSPKKVISSSAHEIYGKVNGKDVSFAWQQPDTKWGPGWVFLTANIGEKSTKSNGEDLSNAISKGCGNIPGTWRNYSPSDEVKKLIKTNIQNFKNAIAKAKKL